MGGRCQVCDGPIVNGRCKLCGMPYRNDEVLYHLNESRGDHYRHATPKAKQIMKKQEVPADSRNSSLGRNSSKEEIKAHQEKIRRDAVERMTASKARPAGRGINSGSRTVSRPAGSSANGKSAVKNNQKKAGKTIRLILLIAIIILTAAPEVFDYIKEQFIGNIVGTGAVSEDIDKFYSWEEESDGMDYICYSLGTEYGEITVGEDLDAGLYVMSVDAESAVVEVRNRADMECEIHEDSPMYVNLTEGDTVWVREGSSADRVVFSILADSGDL